MNKSTEASLLASSDEILQALSDVRSMLSTSQGMLEELEDTITRLASTAGRELGEKDND